MAILFTKYMNAHFKHYSGKSYDIVLDYSSIYC